MAAREPDLESDFGDGKTRFLRTDTKASEDTVEPQVNTLHRHSEASEAAVPRPNPAARVIGDFRTLRSVFFPFIPLCLAD